MMSDDSMIAVGGGNKMGLYIFSEFSKGTTNECSTFNNNALTSNEFKIAGLEVWGCNQ